MGQLESDLALWVTWLWNRLEDYKENNYSKILAQMKSTNYTKKWLNLIQNILLVYTFKNKERNWSFSLAHAADPWGDFHMVVFQILFLISLEYLDIPLFSQKVNGSK